MKNENFENSKEEKFFFRNWKFWTTSLPNLCKMKCALKTSFHYCHSNLLLLRHFMSRIENSSHKNVNTLFKKAKIYLTESDLTYFTFRKRLEMVWSLIHTLQGRNIRLFSKGKHSFVILRILLYNLSRGVIN